MFGQFAREMMGTIPGWITSGGVMAILYLVMRWQLGLKNVAIEAGKVQITAKAQHDADEADIRDHYAQEVTRLTEKLDQQSKSFREDIDKLEDRYRKLIDDSEERHERDRCLWERRWMDADANHEQCLKERAELRQLLEGLNSQIRAQSTDRVLLMERNPDAVAKAPEAAASAKRVKKILDRKEKRRGKKA